MNTILRRLLIGAGAVLLVGIVVLGAGWLYFVNYSPDRARYPVRGIDVSHHQGAIDWPLVAADDVSFVIIKATEGGDYVDERFAENLRDARAAGLTVGAYHYFTLCRPGAEQAANFLATVPRDQDLLPPVVDLEYEGNCDADRSPEAVRAELDAFLAPVEAAFGQQAVFYITYGFFDDYAKYLPRRPLWTRWIAWHPADENWLLWQYHNAGRVNGIDGDVDLNVLQGGRETLTSLVRLSPA
ncbi:MAG: glycoside hydrolase family 25 [Devosia sp.]|uniref:glycoside hydrolase family 25 protein n=1 Tax=Devosia sp. TaxID=1871048 RepID=UPI002610E243|nr:GH25 family lysozyme [Devosia sp.]MDB5529473.1 glycoside hydrolase family 25 [Devosia sp.]